MHPQATVSTGAVNRAPSPDFSSLSPEELERLEVVLQQQALIENEQNQRLSGLRRTMLHLQQTIQNDHHQQQQQRTFSLSYPPTSPTQQNQNILSSSDIVQCYICYSKIDIQSDIYSSSSPSILCADCHRPVCRRCGNYTSPELVLISHENNFENQTHTSKWRCRMCIVRREVVRKSGSWNITEDEIPAHSPVRLLQKLAAYRATATGSPTSSSSPSPSPHNGRKSTILTESTNFFIRLWRAGTSTATNSQSSTSSTILIASHEAASSASFDHIPEPSPAHVESPSSSSNLSPSIIAPHRRMSFMRDVSFKNQTPLVPSHSFQPQITTSTIVTNPSFDDTTSEHPCDTASEVYSQSFETNIDSSVPALDDEQQQQQQASNYNERQRRISLTTKSVIPLVQTISSHPLQLTSQHHSDSLASPEANIDVSMAMDYFSTSMITTESLNDSSEPLIKENATESSSTTNNNNNNINRRASRSYLRNSDIWVQRRTLMNRSCQWTTTYEGVKSTTNDSDPSQSLNSATSLPDPNINSSSSSTTTLLMNMASERPHHIPHDILRRRRSSRRLPEIPTASINSDANIPEEAAFTSSSYSSTECPSLPLRENSFSNRSNRSKSIDSESSLKTRSIHPKLAQTAQLQNAKSVDVSNLTRQKSFLIVNNTLLPQRSLDYPCIVRKAHDLSDIVRRRMLYSKINKQQQGDNFSLSLEREHVPKVPRKIIIRQDNSIEIALSKPPKLRRQTLSEEYYYEVNPESEFASIAQAGNSGSTLGVPIPSSASGLPAGDRRKTIETCENIYLHAEESSKLRARTPPSNPHRILLHRDKNDTSIRTNGLGMRIVGGQECEDGSLGCFVTSVLYGGPADVQGNIEVGDQILEFNGHSLIESTYEEVRILQDHCGDIVQLVVQHNNVRLQINGGQTLSSIEISRHFETVPRLASSLTRKRRNLPPLPPTMTSTFPKQQKRELYETVETLEVPSVKELKPILINRGRLLAQLWHDTEDLKLALTIIQASNLPLRANSDQPYAFIMGKMIFEDRGFDMFETKVIHSSNPVYNETFVFHEVENVDVLHLEILLWDKRQYQAGTENTNESTDESDEFLGMVQLPLNEANLEDEPRWYELRDRQARKPSATSVTFKSSSIESGDSCRKMPPFFSPTKPSTERTRASKDLFIRALNRSIPQKADQGRRSSSLNKKLQRTSIVNPNVPSITMTSIEDEDTEEQTSRRISTITIQSVKLKRRISKGILKLFDSHSRHQNETSSKTSPSSSPQSPATRKLSSQMHSNVDSEDDNDSPVGMTLENTTAIINKSPRHSIISNAHQDDQQQQQQTLVRPIPLQQMPIGQLMLPYIPSSRHSSISNSRKSSAASYCDSDDDIDRYFTPTYQQENDQMNENSNVQTHTVGPGQVTPRNYENMINDYIHMGQIQLGLIVTKGLLEIDIICARGLQRVTDDGGSHHNNTTMRTDYTPPDTYVKTYLRTGTRRVQKRKTAIVRTNFNPEYHVKLKYNACNVMGRRLQVTVWQRAGKFEKNQCIGEAFIQLDNLTLTQHTIAWYKLFREKLVESEFYDSS